MIILTKKGQILEYIKNNKNVRTNDVFRKFGNSGHVARIMSILNSDGLIEGKFFNCKCCKYWVIKK